MKTLYYITDDNFSNLLDFASSEQLSIKKAEGEGDFDIERFVKTRIDVLNQFGLLVFNRFAFQNSDTEFYTYINSLTKLLKDNIRLIIVWQGLEDSKEVSLRSFNNIGIGNICISKDLKLLKEELKECLSDKGMQRYAVKNVNGVRNYNFTCNAENPVAIVFLGLTKKAGCTMFSFSFANYLQNSGASVTYINEKEYELLCNVKDLSVITTDIGDGVPTWGTLKNGLNLISRPMNLKSNFYIFDFGSVNNTNNMQDITSFLQQIENIKPDMIVMLGSIMPLCDSLLKSNYKFFDTFKNKMLIINEDHFVIDVERNEAFLAEIDNIKYCKNNTCLIDAKTNSQIYEEIISKYKI